MDTSPFSFDSQTPLIQALCLFYSVSGEALGQSEVIQVVARLPFCLYIPPTRYLLSYPQTGELIGFVPEKIWSDRAEGSIDIQEELVMLGRIVYLNEAEIITEWIGVPETAIQGPRGRNVEFDKDPSGYFRFSRLTIELDWTPRPLFDPYKKEYDDQEGVIKEISNRVLKIANHIIDLYRVVTGDAYIERVSYLIIEDIRIGIPGDCSVRVREGFTGEKSTYKCGYHPYFFSYHGIRPAIVSKPSEVIDAFRSALKGGICPETHELLRLSADAALDRRDAKMAIIESFTSLEIYVEQFYYRKLSHSMSSARIKNLLAKGNNWRLKVRLKTLLKAHFSKTIADMNNDLWVDWVKAHRKRSDLIHHNTEPNLEETKKIMELNEAIKQLLETL